MIALTHLLLASPVRPAQYATLADFRAGALALPFEGSVDRAAAAGFMADRLGYAFAGGYHAALRRLVPSLRVDEAVCLCATEAGGGHPRAIETHLAQSPAGGWTLTGTKTWSTLADPGATLLVVASLGAGSSGKNRLKVVRVPASRAGVTIRVRPPAPFAPEIPHAEVDLAAVAIEGAEILEGDGYDRYLKPFRTVEDIHVLAAALGYLVGVARTYEWPREIVDGLVADIVALRALGAEDASRAEVHVALAGTLATIRRRLADAAPEWEKVDPEERARWERDRVLLNVADGARTKRREAAWTALTLPRDGA